MAFSIAVLLALELQNARAQTENSQPKPNDAWREPRRQWLDAGSPGESSPAGEAYMDAAIHSARPDLVEELLAGGNVMKKMRPAPRGGKRVHLHVLHTFLGFRARLEDEMFSSFSGEHGWLARRLTTNAVEVWTSRHGWLFDNKGRTRHEAIPARLTGWGRQWYGAFLPDGRWVTTDLDEMDGLLTFFSPVGARLRALSCDQLAPPNPDASAKLIGWARSDREGKGWVVNVGSEQGCSVWVGPDGPARVLKPGERWDLCYPRALGPRGTDWGMSAPSDDDRWEIARGEASHGPHVGFPTYSIRTQSSVSVDDWTRVVVPDGNYVFGFWPREERFFIGAEGNYDREENDEHEASGLRTRKMIAAALPDPVPIIDKTWFFDASGKLVAWLRARRVGDAADRHAMLFRMTTDSRIITLGPDLRVLAVRRFLWKDGSTGDAVTLWDDLRIGLYIRGGHLVLAGWDAR